MEDTRANLASLVRGYWALPVFVATAVVLQRFHYDVRDANGMVGVGVLLSLIMSKPRARPASANLMGMGGAGELLAEGKDRLQRVVFRTVGNVLVALGIIWWVIALVAGLKT